jgi:hypothetical protein
VVQVANKVRAQVKTFTREDEQVLSKICSEQLPAAIANAVVADWERFLQRRSLGLFNALRALKREIVEDGDSVKLQPMLKSFQMNMCDVMLVDECACYVINDGADATSHLLGWSTPDEEEDAADEEKKEVRFYRADGDPVKTFDPIMRLMVGLYKLNVVYP